MGEKNKKITRFFDKNKQRLIYIRETASKEFWTNHWDSKDFRAIVKSTPNSFVTKFTAKYLPLGSKILEGGCGQGNHVYALQHNGFNATGLDFSENTVNLIKKYNPELNIVLGDVFELPFNDNSFHGYWSIGVIEHYWDGYNTIAKEMERVICKGGYLFLTFPWMSVLRKLKSKYNYYPEWDHSYPPNNFFQFALDENQVINSFNELGFKLVDSSGLGGVKGLREEVQFLSKFLKKIYYSTFLPGRILRRLINLTASNYFGHSKQLIFRKL